MKLLFIQDYLRGGGTEKNTVFLANAFAGRGASVTLMTFRPGGVLSEECDPAVKRLTLQPFDLRLNFLSPGLIGAIRAEAPDVVVLMGLMANNLGGAIKQKFPKISVVANARTGKPFPRKNWKTFRVCDQILCNSQWSMQRLVRGGIDPSKIETIPNSLMRDWSVELRGLERLKVRQDLGIADDAFVMVKVVGFRPRKGHIDLLRTLQRLPEEADWRLLLCGSGSEEKKCIQFVNTNDLTHRVHFLGHVKDPFKYLAASDVFVSMSSTDSLPNAMVEAQSVGLPIVAYDTAGVGECFENGRTGYLIEQDEKDAFVERVIALMSQSHLSETIEEPARAWANLHFSKSVNLERYAKIFEKMVREASS